MAADPPAPPEITRTKLLALLAMQCAVMIGLGLALWYGSDRPLSAFIAFSLEELWKGLVLGGALILLAFALWKIFPQAGEKLIRMQADQYAFLLPHVSWPVIVAVSLCAGFGEEALFRAGLQTLLGDYVGMPAAIALSAAVFAVIHLGKPIVTALIFLIGCLFGIVYWWTGSLLIVAIGHAIYDVWALRYLQSELLRLGLIGSDVPPLANHADAV